MILFLRQVRRIGMGTGGLWLRQRSLVLPFLFALVITASVGSLRHLNFGGTEALFVLDAGFSVLGLFGGAMAILGPIQTCVSEFEQGTYWMVRAKGVTPAQIVFGGIFGQSFVLGVFCFGVMAGFWLVHASTWTQATLLTTGSFVVVVLVYWMKLCVLLSLAYVVGARSRSVVAGFGHTLGLAALCHMHGLMEAIEAQSSHGSVVILFRFLRSLLPNLSSLDLTGRLADGSVLEPAFVLLLGVYATGCTVGLGLVASAVLERREH